MSELKFTIITVSLNSEKYIENTILSVARQTYKNIEHIIIDGGSTDSTIDILSKYDSCLSYWASEPDHGIADAMNKGIIKATGDYILFINSDDYLFNEDTLKQISILLSERLDLYIFKVLFIYPNNKKIIKLNKDLSFLTNLKMGSCHQGHVVSRELFQKYGVFDDSFKIALDYDFLLRIYRKDIKSKSIGLVISCMRKIGVSSKDDWPSLKERFMEERRVHKKYCKNIWWKLFYSSYWCLYLIYRKIKYLIYKFVYGLSRGVV